MCSKKPASLRVGVPLYVILASLQAHGAEPYRLELHGGFSSMDSDDSSYREFTGNASGSSELYSRRSSDRLDLAGEYYFDPVDTADGPLKEAAFLARTSALSFAVSELRTDVESRQVTTTDPGSLDSEFTGTTKLRGSEYDIRYRFVAPRSSWIGIVGYGYADQSPTDGSNTAYSVGFGRYVGQRTSVVAEYRRSRLDSVVSVRNEILTVGVHSLLELGTQRHLGLSAQLDSLSTDAGHSLGTYEIGVTYYPRNDMSIGLSATGDYHRSAAFGSADRHGYELEASWFVTESIALGMGYAASDERSDFGDSSLGDFGLFESNTDGFRFTVSWRR